MKPKQEQLLKNKLKDLDRQMAGMSPDQEAARMAMILGQKGLIYSQLNRWSEAARDFGQVVQLSETYGDHPAVKARTYTMLALALLNLPDKHQECSRVVRLAISNAEQCDHHGLACKGYLIQSNLLLFEGKFDEAMQAVNRAVDWMDPQSDPEPAVQALRARAALLLIFLQIDQARTDLEKALSIARQNGDPKQILETEFDIQAINYFASNDPAHKDPDTLFAGLLQQAATAENKAIYGDVQLFRAAVSFNSKRYKATLKYADETRRQALQSPDPQRFIRYLLACLLIAETRDRLDDRPGTLQILLTCKKTFETTLNKESGQLLLPALDSLKIRWGTAGLQEALATYRQQMGVE